MKQRNILSDELEMARHWQGAGDTEYDYAELMAEEEITRRVVPNPHELIQTLHHAVAYDSTRVFMVIGDNDSVMAIFRLEFDEDLMKAYMEILQDLEPFFDFARKDFARKKVPPPPKEVKLALKSEELKYLKMNEDSYMSWIGMWRAMNVNRAVDLTYPLPTTARIIPFATAAWNQVKGGGDTLTKFDDSIRERIGIRTPTTIASTRILVTIATVFHRARQFLTAKSDLDSYPSLYHFRNANSKRTTMINSARLLSDSLVKLADRDANRRVLLTITPTSVGIERLYEATPPVVVLRRSDRLNKTPPAPILPFGAPITGVTPTKRGATMGEPAEVSIRRSECIGLIYSRRVTVG